MFTLRFLSIFILPGIKVKVRLVSQENLYNREILQSYLGGKVLSSSIEVSFLFNSIFCGNLKHASVTLAQSDV